MQKLFACFLLICIAVSSVISQDKDKLSPTPSRTTAQSQAKNTDSTKPSPTAHKHHKYRHGKWAQIVRLRKENKRLRALLVRQKRQARLRNKSASRRQHKKQVNRPATIVTTTATLSDAQLETIANKVYTKLKGEKVVTSLSASDLDKIAALVQGKDGIKPASGTSTDQPGDPTNGGIASTLSGYWETIKVYLQAGWIWVSDHPYYASLAVLGLIVLIFLAFRLAKRKRKAKVSFQPTRISRIFDWFQAMRSNGVETNSITITEQYEEEVAVEAKEEAEALDLSGTPASIAEEEVIEPAEDVIKVEAPRTKEVYAIDPPVPGTEPLPSH